jgi:uncharacterized tellurite resistance protein B-like protein
MSLWTWLGLDGPGTVDDVEGVAEIERSLAGLEPARAHHVACFAYILTRGARADLQITDGEARSMGRIVAERGGIPPEQAAVVVDIARIQALRSGGTDDYLVTRQFNAIASHEQKLALLDCLFAVTASDESILTVEDNEIRNIANELKIDHPEYIAVRSRHVKYLRALRERGRL